MARVAKKGKKRGRRPGRPAKKAKRGPGRSKGFKVAKRRGRPAGRRGRKAAGSSMTLTVTDESLQFWNEMIVFLNENKGKNFIVQTDGKNFSLVAG